MTDQAPDAARAATLRVTTGLIALVASRLVTTPVSIVVSAVLARSLGAPDFGAIYLANTGLTLIFLFVDFGTSPQIAAAVARQPKSAAAVLASGVMLRLVFGALVMALLPLGTRLLGYSDVVRMVFMLTAVRCTISSLAVCAGAVVRGLELIAKHAKLTVITTLAESSHPGAGDVARRRPEGGAARHDRQRGAGHPRLGGAADEAGDLHFQLARADVTSLLGGGLAFSPATWRCGFALPRRHLPLQAGGAGGHGVVRRLQPDRGRAADAGDHAQLRHLSGDGAVIRPRSLLAAGEVDARPTLLFAVMAAVGAAVFADFGIAAVYGRERYAPAVANLQLMSIWVGLVFVSMLLGCAIMAAGRQLVWAGVQALCIPVSLILDPLLIPWFERRAGNGGLGVCIAVDVAEILMVTGGLLLLPRGVLQRGLLADVGRALLAGTAMAAAGFLLRGLPVLAIAVACAAYLGVQAVMEDSIRRCWASFAARWASGCGSPSPARRAEVSAPRTAGPCDRCGT